MLIKYQTYKWQQPKRQLLQKQLQKYDNNDNDNIQDKAVISIKNTIYTLILVFTLCLQARHSVVQMYISQHVRVHTLLIS